MSTLFKTNMLAFSRSLEISEGLLFASNSQSSASEPTLFPVSVKEKGVRGQTSNFSTKNPGDVLNAGKSNLQVVEYAALPHDCDTLHIQFSLLVVPNSQKPQATDSDEVASSYKEFFTKYKTAGGFRTLAERYLTNIANGRFAWRNKTLAQHETVHITTKHGRVVFDAKAISPVDFSVENLTSALLEGTPSDVETLISILETGLTESPQSFKIEWKGLLGAGSEVYPSQEYARSADSTAPSRILAKTANGSVEQAAIHNQKIGAALRCIDNWHNKADVYGPIPVNPYGGIQEIGKAVRAEKDEGGFYEIVQKPSLVMTDLEQGIVNPLAHFFAANLVRGGVFGAKG